MTDAEFVESLEREAAFEWEPYIHQDPAILVGKPVVRGTRLSVEFILDLYAAGWTESKILTNYPRLSTETLRAVFACAAECVSERQERSWPRRPAAQGQRGRWKFDDR